MQHNVSNPLLLSAPLRALRTGKGLTQEQAGSSVGLLPKTISALENNCQTVSALDMELVLRPKSREQQGAW